MFQDDGCGAGALGGVIPGGSGSPCPMEASLCSRICDARGLSDEGGGGVRVTVDVDLGGIGVVVAGEVVEVTAGEVTGAGVIKGVGRVTVLRGWGRGTVGGRMGRIVEDGVGVRGGWLGRGAGAPGTEEEEEEEDEDDEEDDEEDEEEDEELEEEEDSVVRMFVVQTSIITLFF